MALINGTNAYSRSDGNSSHGQNTITHYYNTAGIKAANAKAVYAQWADKHSMPLKHGLTYKISKWLHIYDRAPTDAEFGAKGYLSSRGIADVTADLNAVAIAEGATTGNKQTIQKITIETSFARYGEILPYTDEVEMFSEDYVQVRYREELGALANQRFEDLIQRDMLGTTNVMYAGTATSNLTLGANVAADGSEDNDFRVSYDLIRKGVRKLVRNRAPKSKGILVGSDKVGTMPVPQAYYAIIGAEVKYDLERVTRGTGNVEEFAYIPFHKYGTVDKAAQGEVGAMGDVRFIESESAMVYHGEGAKVPAGYAGTLATTTLSSADASRLGNGYTAGDEHFDAFPILFPTEGSFATVGLKGQGKIKFNAQSPSKIELGNPFGTNGFFSYNMWYAGLIIREERLLKMMVLASA